jgi:hypothetical protein
VTQCFVTGTATSCGSSNVSRWELVLNCLHSLLPLLDGSVLGRAVCVGASKTGCADMHADMIQQCGREHVCRKSDAAGRSRVQCGF